jgi:DNA helicase HerA-like ATPase
MHTLICGVTMSGKTTLAHKFAAELAKKKQNIIVFDPVMTPTSAGSWPESAIIFDDEIQFFDYLVRDDVNGAHIFIDEAGDVFNLSKPWNNWLLTRGRHFGFSVFLIAQRPKMLAPTVRNQCGVAYVFRLARDDLKEIAADFGFSDLQKIELDKGDFLRLNSGSASFSRGNVFNLK